MSTVHHLRSAMVAQQMIDLEKVARWCILAMDARMWEPFYIETCEDDI